MHVIYIFLTSYLGCQRALTNGKWHGLYWRRFGAVVVSIVCPSCVLVLAACLLLLLQGQCSSAAKPEQLQRLFISSGFVGLGVSC